MKRPGPLSRTAWLESGGTLRRRKPLNRYARISAQNRRRREAERLRAYGPPERRDWLTSQPCATCGRVPWEDAPSQQSHIVTAGTSRKADADQLIAQCADCHGAFHAAGSAAAFERAHGLPEGFLARAAAETERLWQRHNANQ